MAIFKYIDKVNKRNVSLDTDLVHYIAYYEDNNRAVIYKSNGFDSFSTNLGDLMIEFVNIGLATYVYCVGNDGRHFLVNAEMIVSYFLEESKTHIKFENGAVLKIPSIYAYSSIQKTIEKYGIVNEPKDSGEIHTSSEGNS